jgi:hypothetical protein
MIRRWFFIPVTDRTIMIPAICFGYPDPTVASQQAVPIGGGHSGYVVQAGTPGCDVIEEAERIGFSVSHREDGYVQAVVPAHTLDSYFGSGRVDRPWVGLGEFVDDDRIGDGDQVRLGLRPEKQYGIVALVLDPAYDDSRVDPVTSRAVEHHLYDLASLLENHLRDRR